MLRDAATLILFKKDQEGMRVLMGMRNAGHKFMPNRMVFPGGGVDPADFGAEVTSPLSAPVLARLERAATPELAAALGNAAARELEEETGLSLGRPPALAGLDYLCRAETPATVSIRFNARFFVAPAELAIGEIAGSGELEALDWYLLESLLQMQVPLVTRLVLAQLQSWVGLDAAAQAGRKVQVFRAPNWEEE